MRGRPHTVIRKDPERFAVALLAAQIKFAPARGIKAPVRKAASYAALFLLGYTTNQPKFHSGPPPADQTKGNKGQRRAPSHRIFLNGFIEITYDKPAIPVADQFNSTADTLRHKLVLWKQRPDGAAWLGHMEVAWACALYPRMIVGIWGRNPVQACRRAAELAGESDFAAEILLPHLRKMAKLGHR